MAEDWEDWNGPETLREFLSERGLSVKGRYSKENFQISPSEIAS